MSGPAVRGAEAPKSAAAGTPRPRGGRSRPVLVSGLLAAVALLLLAVTASLAVGSGDIAFHDVVRGVLDPDPGVKGQLIVQEVRVPRTVAGLLAGVALGLAGTVMQGVARNPLADPQLLGVNAGASVAVVCSISVFGLTVATQYIWFGFLGALLAALLVYGVGSLGREGATPVKLALAGAATSAVLTSATSAVLLQDRETYDRFRFWQLGALNARDTEVLWQAAPFVAAGVLLALLIGPQLNALSLGDDLARGLGQRVGIARLVAALAVVLLCGAATVVAGPIGFVGLVVPHAARLITGPDYRWVLPYSMVLAPVLLLVADIVGRVVAPPGEVQVGVVTAAIGCVPFIWLVRRRKLVEL
ncbi:FecCD family ABC transporter permease [Streptomyces fulvorobeus]|uniref:Iron ABC transporter permease n=1 Tax=Streptomyces fulvorobeus TaxID=284028 RepID=A0A7J0C2P8_9ACTN|nr:iron ABC transporter permease [Streptomyces fulvorobeus]NYE40477.1 iron complex transport system permease protein [Streptomyces fulvorobeus]GFM96762.1 iron ABC transporter permease [Streptomyces fulvorobeus]